MTENQLADKDASGFINIPSATSFWIIVNKKAIYFVNERRDPTQKFFYSILFSNNNSSLSLKSLGKFD